MAAMKVRDEDVPLAIERILWRIRQGLRAARDHQILLVTMPKTIDLSFEILIRKDDLTRIETSQRDPSTTTSTTGEQVSDSVQSGGGSITDSDETSTTVDSGTTTGGELSSEGGGDISTDSGTDEVIDTGSSDTVSGHSSLDTGGEVESYLYEPDA